MSPLFRLLAVATSLSLVAATPAGAEDKDDSIVVTGDRDKDKAEAEAKHFVRDISQVSGGQLARFHDKVCPVAVGLPEDSAAWLVARVRAVADEVGPGHADQPCKPNIVVIATDDVSSMFRQIRRERPNWLQGVSDYRRKKMSKSSGPVIAWASTSVRNEDGHGAVDNEDVQPGSSGIGQFSKIMRVHTSSILVLPTQNFIDGTVILLDRRALLDKPMLQVSDYVAMRGLARVDPPDTSSVDTVLAAFAPDASDAPDKITVADYAYLQSLYSRKGRETAQKEKARVAEDVARFEPPSTDQ